MITDNVTAALDSAEIPNFKEGGLDEHYPFFVMLEKAQTANVNGFWRQRYNLHLVFGENDDCDALEKLVIDTLRKNANCFVIDAISPLRRDEELEIDVITIRVVLYP